MKKMKLRGLNGLSDEHRSMVFKKIDEFYDRYSLSSMMIKVDCSPEKEKVKGKSFFTCNVQAGTKKGLFNSTAKKRGIPSTVNDALSKISRQLEK